MRAEAAKYTMKAFIKDSGISFTTWWKLQSGGKNFTMRSINAWLLLIDLAGVEPAERYIELNEDCAPGERIIVMRLKNFLELAKRSRGRTNLNN